MGPVHRPRRQRIRHLGTCLALRTRRQGNLPVQLYPPIHYREIARNIGRKYGYKTNHVTVQRFLERHPIPVQLPLPVTAFHQFEDAYRARWTAVRMYYEGWHQTSIAGCPGLSRQHVWMILQAFQRDGFAGLEDHRTRPPTHPAKQLSLPFLKEVLDVQRAYPRAGRYRIQGLVAKRTGRAERDDDRTRHGHQPPPASCARGVGHQSARPVGS
jgi:Homeodomain-like domain